MCLCVGVFVVCRGMSYTSPYSSRKNPKQMTFQEVYSGFSTGTLTSSSPASRRTAYMGFSEHRRPSVRSHSAPRTGRVSTQPSLPPSTNFEKVHSILIRSHFSALMTGLHENGSLSSQQYANTCASMKLKSWESNTLPSWMSAYVQFIHTKDVASFVNSLVAS